MKNNKNASYIILGILFTLFNVIAFVIPIARTATFFVAYAFCVLAFILQLPLWNIALKNTKNLKNKFLGIPAIQLGVYYLIAAIVAFAVFMIIPSSPVWVAIIVCAVILAVFAIITVAGMSAKKMIIGTEDNIKAKREFIQFLQIDIEMLASSENDPTVKMALLKLAESVRFSDPMSHELLSELEARISSKVEELKSAKDKMPLIEQIGLLLTERNKKCKILK